MLANYYRKRSLKYALWDTVLYGKAQYQPNLEVR